MGDENVSPNFENEVIEGHFHFYKGYPYIVTFHWKLILTIDK